MSMTPEVAAARAAKKRRDSREFAVGIAVALASVLALNIAAFYVLFGDNWGPSSRIALLVTGFVGAALLLGALFKSIAIRKKQK